jgi:hypothetical protein
VLANRESRGCAFGKLDPGCLAEMHDRRGLGCRPGAIAGAQRNVCAGSGVPNSDSKRFRQPSVCPISSEVLGVRIFNRHLWTERGHTDVVKAVASRGGFELDAGSLSSHLSSGCENRRNHHLDVLEFRLGDAALLIGDANPWVIVTPADENCIADWVHGVGEVHIQLNCVMSNIVGRQIQPQHDTCRLEVFRTILRLQGGANHASRTRGFKGQTPARTGVKVPVCAAHG